MAMRNRSVRLTEELDKRIVEHARLLDIPASDVIKEALYNFFHDEEEVSRIEHLLNQLLSQHKDEILARLDEMKPRVETSQEVETPKPKKRLVLKRRVSPIDDELTGEGE